MASTRLMVKERAGPGIGNGPFGFPHTLTSRVPIQADKKMRRFGKKAARAKKFRIFLIAFVRIALPMRFQLVPRIEQWTLERHGGYQLLFTLRTSHGRSK
jgi:hypothetical protein